MKSSSHYQFPIIDHWAANPAKYEEESVLSEWTEGRSIFRSPEALTPYGSAGVISGEDCFKVPVTFIDFELVDGAPLSRPSYGMN